MRDHRRVALIGVLLSAMFVIGIACAQSVPNGGTITQGEVWTPTQWIEAWQSKVDVVGGSLNNPDISIGNGSSITQSGSGSVNATAIAESNLFFAYFYGSCSWNTSGDVGPCINAAYAACSVAGGGDVIVPSSDLGGVFSLYFGQATPIVNNNSGCRLKGAGFGMPYASQTSGEFLAATRLLWTGTPSSTTAMITVQPASTAVQSMWDAGIEGVVFDCNQSAGVAVRVTEVNHSRFRVGGAECTGTADLWFDTNTNTSGPGDQHNDLWLYARSINTTYTATGILLDRGTGSPNFNFSIDVVHEAYAAYNLGDGVDFGGDDNVVVEHVRTLAQGTGSGNPCVVANGLYTPPNGVPVNTLSIGTIKFEHVESNCWIQGFQQGSVGAATGGNTGSGAIATQTTTTSGTFNKFATVITLNSVAGIVAGEVANCGGYYTGMPPNDQVVSISGSNVTLAAGLGATLASGTSCTFSYGFSTQAAYGNSGSSGTYTATYNGSNVWSLTAPTGGNPQSNVTMSPGILAFTDLTAVISGTPNTNDTFTFTIAKPVTPVECLGVDKNNSFPLCYFEAGAQGATAYVGQWPPVVYQNSGGFAICNSAINQTCGAPLGNAAVVMAGAGGATGSNAVAFGPGSAANSTGSFASGHNTTTTGTYGRAGGQDSCDRGRKVTDVWASNELNTPCDAQTATQILIGHALSGGTSCPGVNCVILTSDNSGLTTGANCQNIPANTTYLLTIDVVANDKGTAGSAATWNLWTGMLTNLGGSVAWTANTTPTPLVHGTATGIGIAAAADSGNKCIDITFTAPSVGADVWDAVAKVTTVEVQ